MDTRTTGPTPTPRAGHAETVEVRPGTERGVAPAQLSRASWGAIFAAAISAVAILALLTLLGLGIGLGTIDPATEENTLSGLGWGTVIWLVVSTIIAMAAGGFMAGRLAGQPSALASSLHGVVVWALATLALLYLAGSAIGTVASGAAGVFRQAASTASTALGQAASLSGNAFQAVSTAVPDDLPPAAQQALERWNVSVRTARRELVELLNRSGIGQQEAREASQATAALARDLVTSPGDAGEDISAYAEKLFGGPDAVITPEERQRVLTNIQQRTGLSDQEVQQTLTRIEATLQDARTGLVDAAEAAQQTALQAAQTATNVLSDVAWAFFGALLLGLAAAVGAAIYGSPARAELFAARRTT